MCHQERRQMIFKIADRARGGSHSRWPTRRLRIDAAAGPKYVDRLSSDIDRAAGPARIWMAAGAAKMDSRFGCAVMPESPRPISHSNKREHKAPSRRDVKHGNQIIWT